MYRDTWGKIFGVYFRGMALYPFTVNGHVYQPIEHVIVSPDVMRGYTCPSNCGACCNASFTLVYLEYQTRAPGAKSVPINVNGRVYNTYQFSAPDEPPCRFLNKDGRCNIHPVRPFACDFELTRFIITEKLNSVRVSTQLYGRGWNMKRVTDNKRGARCTITPVDSDTSADTIRKFKLLAEMMDYLRVPHIIYEHVIPWMEGDCSERLVINKGEIR